MIPNIFEFSLYREHMCLLGLGRILTGLETAHSRGNLVRIIGNHFRDWQIQEISVGNYRVLIERDGRGASEFCSAVETYLQVRQLLQREALWLT